MTTRLCPPDGAVKEMEVITSETGARVLYPQQADGTMYVDDPAHARTLRSYGAFLPAGARPRAPGWRCGDCEFLGWFRQCRCGSMNTEREC